MTPCRVTLVEDHPVFRQGLKRFLEETSRFRVCSEADDVPSALTQIAKHLPDLVITDVSLKNSNGIDLVRSLTNQYPFIKTIVLSMYSDELYGAKAMRSGARGYLMKIQTPSDVLQAIERVVSGEVYVSDRIAQHYVERIVGGRSVVATPVDRLSDRELEIFKLIGIGRGTRQIAETLGLSIKTIESHRAHIKSKLNLASAIDLVQMAGEWATAPSAR